jgi:hypothetical protein
VVEEEKKEEPEDVDMGGLFGDEDDYWEFEEQILSFASTK